MFEVEAKYGIADPDLLRQKILDSGGIARGIEVHRDTYVDRLQQPLRDTGAALRIRQVGRRVRLTYKGPRLSGEIKTREEIELFLADEPNAEAAALALIDRLGFLVMAVVFKRREAFELEYQGEIVRIYLDQVEQLGSFAEVEILSGEHGVEAARITIDQVSKLLGLDEAIQTSYLTMLLALAHQPPRADNG
jgi:adenylate cyclase class 2